MIEATMVKRIPEQELIVIEETIRHHAGGAALESIERALQNSMQRRTLQHRLKHLVAADRIAMTGERRWARYHIKGATEVIVEDAQVAPQADLSLSVSKAGAEVRRYVHKPLGARKPVGYAREFLYSYRPNKTTYLSAREREHLRRIGTPRMAAQPAGTYAKQILSRLLVDLSWNSSRLEGNTYSLLDTKRLIAFGREAEGKDRIETQMILNHKDAIEFLVSEAQEIGFNRYTLLNLHGMLANNLLADPLAAGRLR